LVSELDWVRTKQQIRLVSVTDDIPSLGTLRVDPVQTSAFPVAWADLGKAADKAAIVDFVGGESRLYRRGGVVREEIVPTLSKLLLRPERLESLNSASVTHRTRVDDGEMISTRAQSSDPVSDCRRGIVYTRRMNASRSQRRIQRSLVIVRRLRHRE
jgi:hypothetical protein